MILRELTLGSRKLERLLGPKDAIVVDGRPLPSGVGLAGEVVVVLAAPSRGRRPVKISPMLEVSEHHETLE